ncbi:putative uncharacterized protein DDB_G0285119 [Bactrocera oleae]|uniref:putative uncharacterized protein DDB_G0285119 n=1 Tax=Bactrocera oleae TaxID=104688 RepID=UPI00387E2CD5
MRGSSGAGNSCHTTKSTPTNDKATRGGGRANADSKDASTTSIQASGASTTSSGQQRVRSCDDSDGDDGACHTQFKYVKLVQIVISTVNDERTAGCTQHNTLLRNGRAGNTPRENNNKKLIESNEANARRVGFIGEEEGNGSCSARRRQLHGHEATNTTARLKSSQRNSNSNTASQDTLPTSPIPNPNPEHPQSRYHPSLLTAPTSRALRRRLTRQQQVNAIPKKLQVSAKTDKRNDSTKNSTTTNTKTNTKGNGCTNNSTPREGDNKCPLAVLTVSTVVSALARTKRQRGRRRQVAGTRTVIGYSFGKRKTGSALEKTTTCTTNNNRTVVNRNRVWKSNNTESPNNNLSNDSTTSITEVIEKSLKTSPATESQVLEQRAREPKVDSDAEEATATTDSAFFVVVAKRA